MPRGSRPGERRGGRQKGTPNKKTLLHNAALSAAAADPNLSPLDYLLNVMRDQTLPLETRIAAAREALPFFHSKPQELVARQTAPSRYGDAFRGSNGGWSGPQSVNIKIFKGGLISPAVESKPGVRQCNAADPEQEQDCLRAPSNMSAAEVMPLEFLLAVMRSPDTPPGLRLRIASLVARYVHPKQSTDGPPKIAVEDPTGFSIDPRLAVEFRDANFRYNVVYTMRISQPEHYQREAAGLQTRIAEIQRGLQCPCPSLYGEKQLTRDSDRLNELLRVRHSGLKLSMQQDIEEAWLTARVASWSTIPECAARLRLKQLDDRRWDVPWSRRWI